MRTVLVSLALAGATLWVGACSSSSNGGSTTDAGSNDGGATDGGEAGVDLITWQPCGTNQCAFVSVPVDYDVPEGPTFMLAVVRVPASDPSHRIGSVFVNFGGPGVTTVAQLSADPPPFPLLAGSANDTLHQRFDLIGIDWRGVGESTPDITCYTPTIEQAMRAAPVLPKTDPEWTALFAATDQIKGGCQSRNDAKLMAHLDTATAARDVETVRSMLGEDKVSFLGYSYGTFLYATYATAYSAHVRAMALDSPIVPQPDRRDRWRQLAPAQDDALDQFFAWCATSASCTFGPSSGRTADSLAAAYDALTSQLDTTPIATSTEPLDGAAVKLATLYFMYSPMVAWTQLGTGLKAAADGDGSKLRPVADFLIAPSDDPSNNAASTFVSIFSLDSPLPDAVTAADIRTFIEGEMTTAAPRLGAVNALNELAPVVGWPFKTTNAAPSISAPIAPPILLTATRHDPAVPYVGAAALQTALGNGSYLVTYEGSGHVNGSQVECMGTAIGTYLVDPTTAPTSTSCAAVAF